MSTISCQLKYRIEAIEQLHTVIVIFEQQRPVAGVNRRRRRLRLDDIVGIRFDKSHGEILQGVARCRFL